MPKIYRSILGILAFVLSISHNILSQHVRLDEKELLKLTHIEVDLNDPWVSALNLKGIYTQPRGDVAKPDADHMPPLFAAFPGLVGKLAYKRLGSLPTPVQKLEQLGKAINAPQLYIKRDDSAGACIDGKFFYGGNKVRKLEFLLAEALSYGAKHVITFGCAGSNHAVATSCYAEQLGLRATCMLLPQANSHGVQQNLALHQAHKAEVKYCSTATVRKLMTFTTWLQDYQETGCFPYLIHTGGSNATGVIGFVNAAFELKQQIAEGLMPEPDYIYVACGSCGTAAGLVVGCKAAGLKTKIVAVPVQQGSKCSFKTSILGLATDTNDTLHALDESFPRYDLLSAAYQLTDDHLQIKEGFGGPRYAVFNKEGMEAKKLLQEKENILLDGTYTAKACAGLLDDCMNGELSGRVILFWDTYCGLDFSDEVAGIDYHALPKALHTYFETEVQELDKNNPA
jgi:1-aminocyclopropane-1-carboxylate deaminase/D-cysteine desulfhydrase-like pyridoxal-dependent ACC family enzyme